MVYADRRGLFMNGKAEAASGAPTCEKRVNTFSFCGTGGSLRKNGAKVILCPSFFGLKAKNRKKTASKQLPERFFYDIIIWQVQRRPHGQAVKTSPSHGENRGSSPRGATKKRAQAKACALFLVFRRNRELRRGFARAQRCSTEGAPSGVSVDSPRGCIKHLNRRPHGQAVKTSPSHGENRGSRERSDAQPRGPLQGFRLIPRPPQAKACAIFLVFRRNRELRRGFARAQRRSTEGLFICRKQTPRTFHAGRFPQ